MSSLINLEEPYKSRWRKGYLQTHPNGRKYVCLYNNETDRSLVSYARYLMSVKTGQFLPDSVEVDHRNDNATDDRLDNLKIMSVSGNRAKQANNCLDKREHHLICDTCEQTFTFSERDIKQKEYQGVDHVFCSRSCSTKFHKSLSEEQILQIKTMRAEGKSSYKINELTGFARNTIMKYW